MTQELSKREKQEVVTTSAEQLIDSGNAYSPDTDIYDSGEGLVFVMDLPGVPRGDVKIEIDENDVLLVRAKTAFREPQDNSYREFDVGNYFRAFTLSNEFDKDKIGGKLENGVLEIAVPRREEVIPRRIQINA